MPVVPSLPHLPFGLGYAAIGLFLLAVLTGIVQQFFADRIQTGLGRLWRWLVTNRARGIRRDEWTRYQAWVARTYNTMKLGFLQDASVTLDDVYVPLRYEQGGQRIDIYQDIQSCLRTVVVGSAGAGKSMLLRHSMLQWARAPKSFERVPVLIELTRYNRGGRTLQQLIVETLARKDDKRGHRQRPARPLVDDAEQVVATALATGRLCVFLDGLDEVVTDRRADMALDIKEFAEQHPTCQIVVTCRDAVYDNDLRPTFNRQIRVAGFDDAGIRHFLGLWFGRQADAASESDGGDAVGNPPAEPRELVEQLMAALRANPTLMRLARSPLMLTMITSLHDADPGAGPMLTNSRAEFYELAVTHLLRRDRDLGRHRDLAHYRAGHKLMALRAIALTAQGAGSTGTDHRVITEEELLAEMSRLLPRFRLAVADLPKMVNEIVDRSGLLIRIDESNLLYEFAHLTLQEYLAAVELADSPDRLLAYYRENPSRWRETVKLWCAGANRDASALVREFYSADKVRDRLLALECVAEARQIDDALAAQIVDGFAAQLGTDIPDRHLVLAALGAAAGDPGPIGERLFAHLERQAWAGGRVGDDAIVALAESRRRSAIETVSELAEQSPAARAALRSTGELAIPVLASRARAGWLAAVDDLAAIGTPAAAVAVAEQLWGNPGVAARAAWRLAALICAPDVEGELRRFDPTPFQSGDGDWYDWLWAPFVPEGETQAGIAVTMGRVGWLLDQPAPRPNDLGAIDLRLALGLGAQPGAFSSGNVSPKGGPADELVQAAQRKLVQAAQRIGYRRQHSGDLSANEINDMLVAVAVAEPETARHIAVGVLRQRTRSSARGWLLCQLPDPLVMDLAKRLWWSRNLNADTRDWLALNAEPEQSKVLSLARDTAIGIVALLGLGAVGVALTRSVGTLIGWWGWGPRWFAMSVLVSCAVVMIAALLDLGSTKDAVIEIVGGIVGLLAIIGILVIALATVAGWLGWPATVASILVVAGIATLFSVWASRRERAVRNPYRAILRLGERATHFRGTVIARGARDRASSAPSTSAPSTSAPSTSAPSTSRS